MDKKSAAMLRMIVEASQDGESVVIEKQDFLDEIGKIDEINEETLKKVAESLVLNELIEVVYQDDEVYCVEPLAKGRIAVNRLVNPKSKDVGAIKVEVDYKSIAKYAFLGAFIGGLLAGAVFTLIGWLI